MPKSSPECSQTFCEAYQCMWVMWYEKTLLLRWYFMSSNGPLRCITRRTASSLVAWDLYSLLIIMRHAVSSVVAWGLYSQMGGCISLGGRGACRGARSRQHRSRLHKRPRIYLCWAWQYSALSKRNSINVATERMPSCNKQYTIVSYVWCVQLTA